MNDDTAPLSTPSSDSRRRPVVYAAGSLAAVERRGPRLLGRVGFVAIAGALVLAVAMGAAAWSVAGSVGTGDRPDPLWYTPPSVSATTSGPGSSESESAEFSDDASPSTPSSESAESSESGDDKGGSGKGGGSDDTTTPPAAPSSADDNGGSGKGGGSDDNSGSGKGSGSDDNSGSGKGSSDD